MVLPYPVLFCYLRKIDNEISKLNGDFFNGEKKTQYAYILIEYIANKSMLNVSGQLVQSILDTFKVITIHSSCS